MDSNRGVKKYRKKPVVVEALLCGYPNDPQEVANWCGGRIVDLHEVGSPVYITIPTLEGDMRAEFNDYIIKGVKGEFYPCKPDIFKETYEEVE
jgi:hypothetical protein